MLVYVNSGASAIEDAYLHSLTTLLLIAFLFFYIFLRLSLNMARQAIEKLLNIIYNTEGCITF